MKITTRTALELISHEGIVREAYKDSVNVWTWGVGITSKSGHNVERYIKNPQSLEHCISVYVWALKKYAEDVEKAFYPIVLDEHQFAAALSFHYNTGAILKATWVKSWKAGKISQAKKEIMNWRSPKEIIPRREKERDLFFDGVWSNNGSAVEYTRVFSNGQIDWKSRRVIDITKDVALALGDNRGPDKDEIEEHDREEYLNGRMSLLETLLKLLLDYIKGVIKR